MTDPSLPNVQDLMSRLDELTSRVVSIESTRELLIRIDERTMGIMTEMVNVKNGYVRKEEFNPVQKIVYGLVGVILISVMGGILAIILR